MASVFLSYDRDDAKKARPLALHLEKAGHSVWWDLHVRGGAQFSKVIDEALKAAEVVVVLWSSNSIESPWVRDEAGAGRDSGRLVPVTLDGTEPPLGFRQFQTIDFTRWKGRGTSSELRTLLADIQTTAAGRAASADAPAAPVARAVARSHAHFGHRSLMIAGAALLLILLAAGLFWKLAPIGTGVPSVSVTAADASQLSQSMARNVLVNLGSASGSSPANFRLMDDKDDARPDFGVTVSGVEVGGNIQAMVTLVSSKQKAVLWSRQIAQPNNLRGNLEQAAAYAAMAALACATDRGAAYRSLNTGVLRDYLNACVAMDEVSDSQPLAATFRKTIASAPNFAAARANLLLVEVDALTGLRASGQSLGSLSSTIRRDIAAARKIDPNLPEATVAEIALEPPTSFSRSMAIIDRALAAHPDDPILLSQRWFQRLSVGRVDAGLDDIERAATLRPYSPALQERYILTLAASGGVEKARSELARAKSLWPDAPSIADTETAFNLRYGDFEAAWRAAGYPIDGGITGYFKILHDPSDANIDAWVNLAKTHKMLRPHRHFILQALGPLNRVDQLYEFLQQWPMEQDLAGETYLLFGTRLTKVRRDPRFMRLSQRLGLLDYWQKSGNWPDFCAEPDMPYDCKAEAAKLK